MSALSVVIPTKNRDAALAALLDSLYAQTRPPDEIIIVDESDAAHPLALTERWLAAHPAACVRLQRATVGSLTRSRNLGAAQAAGENLVFLDDDVLLHPAFLQQLEAALAAAGPAYAGGCGLITADPGFVPRLPKYQAFKRRFGLGHYADGRFLAGGMATLPAATTARTDTEFCSGGVSIYRRAVVLAERFDDAFNGYSNFEDADFSWRVSRRHRLFYEPRAIAFHRDDQDKLASRAARVRFCRMLTQNYLYHCRKNLPRTPRTAAGVVRALAGLLLLAVRRRLLSELRGYLSGIAAALRSGFRPA